MKWKIIGVRPRGGESPGVVRQLASAPARGNGPTSCNGSSRGLQGPHRVAAGWDRANTMRQAVHACAGARTGRALSSGGEGGIRTLDGLSTHTPLAGERLQPLGHLSGGCGAYRRVSPPAKDTPADRISPVHRGDCPRRGGADRTCPSAHIRPPGRRSPRHAPRERRRSRRQHGAAEPSPACPAGGRACPARIRS